jgi:CheY-like chemotaxis protein
LSDVLMPQVDGFQLAVEIRRQTDFPRPAVILLSSADRQPDAARCRQAGVAAYLTKPVKQSELLRAMLEAIRPSTEESELTATDRCRQSTPSHQVRPLSVLLVEDNATNRVLAVALLKKAGHEVATAHNGKEALSVLAKRSFDVVLMDVQMPEMDGFEATARIRAAEQGTGARVPILAMTAHTMKGDRERCLAAGMDGYVSKPVRSEELYEALASTTALHAGIDPNACAAGPEHLEAARATDTGAQPGAAGQAPVVDRAALLARVGGREDRLRTIIQVFLDESSGLVAELDAALQSGDAFRLARPAHALKGAVGLFGVPAVVEAAQTLESLGKAGDVAAAREAFRRLEREMSSLEVALAELLSSRPL